jgi:hypothetical protein
VIALTDHRVLNRPPDNRFCSGMRTIAIGLFSLIVVASVTSIETAACDAVGVKCEGSTAVASCALDTSLDSGVPSGDSVEESMSMSPITVILSVASGLVTLIVLLGFVALSRARAKTGPASANGQDCRETDHLPVLERGSVSERFPAICPFCGSRNEKVESKCNDCGAVF